ncbi:MAG: ATP-binding domain-containing protein, partial [Elusimicrobiaceae bacterium]|nr:ATP-binding domain-containing protein [Elusimicrobiaceae bacterium]
PAFQPAYEPIFTDKPAATVSTEMILISAPSVTALADDYRHNQAEQVANWIKQNVGKLKLKDGRLLTYKDIVILSRAATTLWPYTDALRRAGIAFAIEEDKDFYRRQEVSDFLNMLRVLQDPQDKISLVGVLRSPLGGLTDEEIYQAGKRGELDLRQTSSEEKLEWIFVQLRRLAARAGREPLRLLLREILQETFLAESCAVAYDGERSIENLQRLVTLAEGYSLSTPTTLGQFLTRVQELMEQELGRLTALPEGEGDDAVGVMTVHKSKGLEFPVVILVDISKKDTNNAATRDRHLYSWKYNLHGFRAGKYADINLAWLEEEEKEHSRCEEVRVLYVALTRAKEKLLLVGNRKAEDTSMAGMFARAGVFAPVQENPAQVGACGLAVRYINYVEPEKFIYKSAPHISQGKNQWDLSAWRGAYEKRAAQYAQYQQMPALLSPSALVENNTAENEEALQLGSWVHGALALKMQGTQDTMDDNLQFASTIYEQGHALLAAFYKSETWQKIAAWQSIGAEMPFSLKTAQGVVSGVMDLLARDEQGTVWVLDYKTDQVTPGTEKQAAQKYAPQLAVYLQAAQKLYPAARVQTAVVFVRTSTLIKL